MSFKVRLQGDMKAALKGGEALRLSVVRMALAEIGKYEADKGVEPDEAISLGLIEKMVKQRRDSEAQYRSGARPELADKEAAEIKILQAYLPQALAESEVTALIEQAVKETAAAGAKDMGKVMAWIKPKVAGRTDMGKLSALIKAKLG